MICEKTRQTMVDFLNDLGSVACAKRAFQNQLEIEHPEKDWLTLSADRSINPTIQDWHRLFRKIRVSSFGERNGDFMLNKLREFQNKFGGTVALSTFENEKTGLGEFAFAIHTPFMRQVVDCLPECRDVFFIDSSASCDLEDTSLTFVVTSTSVGAMPIAVVLHSSQNYYCYKKAFELVNQLLGFPPRVILTDDSEAEQKALRSVFDSAILLLCAFHVMQSVFRWLSNKESSVPRDKQLFLLKSELCHFQSKY